MNHDQCIENHQLLDAIAGMLNDMKADVGALLQAQQISNFFELSKDPRVPAELQTQLFERAMNMMGLSHEKGSSSLEDQFIR